MRLRRIAWSTYFQGVAIVLVIFLTSCYILDPLGPSGPSLAPHFGSKVGEVVDNVPVKNTDSVDGGEAMGRTSDEAKDALADSASSRLVVPRVVSMKNELVAWINSIATFQELDALNSLRQALSNGRDSLTLTRNLHQIRPDGWMFCVQEGEVCHCDSGITRYGDFDKGEWVERSEAKSPILCIHAQYGLTPEKDISPGKTKYCQCKAGHYKCPDGVPYHPQHCPAGSLKPCRAGCQSRMQSPRGSLAASLLKSAKLCDKQQPNSLIWSCQASQSLKPPKGHKHAVAEELLVAATAKLCEDRYLHAELEVWLECDFSSQFFHWTSTSPWIDEAYVTYVGGSKDSNYEWQATNLSLGINLLNALTKIFCLFGYVFCFESIGSFFFLGGGWVGIVTFISIKRFVRGQHVNKKTSCSSFFFCTIRTKKCLGSFSRFTILRSYLPKVVGFLRGGGNWGTLRIPFGKIGEP